MGDTEIAKIQLREYLSSLLVPRLSEGFWSIHDSAAKLCEQNKQISETLRTFQNLLTKIPEWSENTLTEEVERILNDIKLPLLRFRNDGSFNKQEIKNLVFEKLKI